MLDHEIGGATVRRGFTRDGAFMRAGTKLSPQDVLAMPKHNRMALVENHFIELFPKAVIGAPEEDLERFVVHRGQGKYDVIEGRKLNSEPIPKETADALAAA